MSENSKNIGDPCPKCGRPLERRKGKFFWRGMWTDGAVCEPCRGLWVIRGEEIQPLRVPKEVEEP